jgi:hypothetical protein
MHKANLMVAIAFAATFSSVAVADDCPSAAGQTQVVLCENDPGATVDSVRARGTSGSFAVGQAAPTTTQPRPLFEVLVAQYRALAARLQRE